jgi:hypothetical protein
MRSTIEEVPVEHALTGERSGVTLIAACALITSAFEMQGICAQAPSSVSVLIWRRSLGAPR